MNKKIQDFLNVSSKRELASCLGIEYHILIYNLYKLDDDDKYITFKIKKKNNGFRTIIAPDSGIKFFQELLSKILLEIYPAKNCVHGYLLEKSIKTNAQVHLKKKILINIDLKDFFPSINFGRVYGIFKSHPFNFNHTISTTLAQICCYKGILPQGAPTSPILSNYVCRKLDNELIDLAKKGRFNYTRYADDLTFSTNVLPLPKELGTISDNQFIISDELTEIIENNGFKLNNEKVRYATKFNRQEVTGLIVNEFVNVKRTYIRQVRAMLNSWEKYGVYEAAREHFERYNSKNKKTTNIELSFVNEVVGKISYIGSVRGKDDTIYQNLYKRIKKLHPKVKLSIVLRARDNSDFPILYGEGKTDWKHLKAALHYFQRNNEFKDFIVQFHTYEDGLEINNNELLKICEATSRTKFHTSKVICLFDRDNKGINKKTVEIGKDYKCWGNNVYSVLLPIPLHRNFEEICIEHYYLDEDIKRVDKNGRRLFLSNEFDQNSGKHINENLIYIKRNYLQSNYPRILDSNVVNPDTGTKHALPKNDFADYIINQDERFDSINFEHFRNLFKLLDEISKK